MEGSPRGSCASVPDEREPELAQQLRSLQLWRQEASELLSRQEGRLAALEERLARASHLSRASRIRPSLVSSTATAAATRASCGSTITLDVEEEDDGSVALTKLEKKRAQNIERIASHAVKISLYEFGMSMWDASILLFVGRVKPADRVLLVAGMVVNVAMQSAMLAVIWRDMLVPDYNPTVTQRLLQWRVWEGQAEAAFHEGMGQTKLQRLCTKTLWSFEQSEYNELFDYLYMPVPGVVLSFLAMILWVLTCVQEFRCISEQFLALRTLPALRKGEESLRLMEYGTFALGIEPLWRWVSFLLLCLPRFAVLASLCTVGCIFLCQTVNLADIMLNAVALAFILDIDEALCAVMLSQRLRNELELMQPMPCGEVTHTCGGVTYTDLSRYVVAVLIVAAASTQVLLPFNADVTAAATALCGGVRDFTYSGGVPDEPMVTLTSAADWVSSCSADINSLYMAQHYPGFLENSSSAAISSTEEEARRLKALTERLVLSQAFMDCPAGQLRTPKGRCQSAPASFTEILAPMQLKHLWLPDCQRLNVTMGWASCSKEAMVACQWSWRAHKCEAGLRAPGLHHRRACGLDVAEACAEWGSFGLEHPRYNCKAVEVCRGLPEPAENVTCLSLIASAKLRLRGAERVWRNTSIVVEAVKEGLRAGLGLSSATDLILAVDLAVSEVMLEPPERERKQGRRLESGLDGHAEAANISAYLQLRKMPKDLKTEAVVGANTSIVAAVNSALNSSLGLPDVLEGLDWEPDFGYATQIELSKTGSFHKLSLQGSYCDMAHPLFNCLMCRLISRVPLHEALPDVPGPPECCFPMDPNTLFPNVHYDEDCCNSCWWSVVSLDVQENFCGFQDPPESCICPHLNDACPSPDYTVDDIDLSSLTWLDLI